MNKTTDMPNGVVNAADTTSRNRCLYHIIYIVFALLIYILESSTSLQLWRISYRPFSTLPQINEKKIDVLRRRTRLALIVKLSLLLILALKSVWRHVLIREERNLANLQEDSLSRDVDFFASVYLIGNMFCILMGATTRVIYRGADDIKISLALVGTGERYSQMTRTLLYMAAATFVIWANIQDFGTLAAVVLHASVLHFFIVNVFQRLPVRGCVLLGLVTIIIFLGVRGITYPGESLVSAISVTATGSEDSPVRIDWLSVLVSGFASATSYVFLASLYRSEFIASRVNSSSSLHVKFLDTDADALLLPSRVLGAEPGRMRMRMLDPSKRHKVPSFRKPYFRAALAGWVVSNIVLALVDSRISVPPSETNVGGTAFGMGLGLTCVSPIFMFLFVFVLSIVRGEPETFWRCRVDWDDWWGGNDLNAQILLGR